MENSYLSNNEKLRASIASFEGDNEEKGESQQLLLDLGGFEGPIDALLELAKQQKVDLIQISILELADQYLLWIKKLSRANVELAADYLVMAAWLTYLKSRLLLPKEEKSDDHTPEELEEALKYQLQRLEAFQKVSKKLYSRSLIGRDVFYGGSSEGLKVKYNITYSSTLFDLLSSYSRICLLYTSPSPRDMRRSRMPSSA